MLYSNQSQMWTYCSSTLQICDPVVEVKAYVALILHILIGLAVLQGTAMGILPVAEFEF